MRPLPLALLATTLVAGNALALEPSDPVQPVPYQPSQPVPVPGGIPATTPGTDVLYLKNGGVLRGSIAELLPNDHATIVLLTGQSAVVQWSAISRVERGPAPALAPALVPAPAPGLPPPPPPYRPPLVLVHIQSTRSVTLERRDASSSVAACTSPCDVRLPLSDEYRIVGKGINASGWFHLDGQPGDRVVLNVAAGTKVAFYSGGVIATVGVLTTVLGLVTIGGASAANQAGQAAGGTGQTAVKGAQALGGLLALTGVVIAGVGAYVLFTNLHSDETQEIETPIPETPHADPQREATWHSPSPLENGLPRATEASLIRLSF